VTKPRPVGEFELIDAIERLVSSAKSLRGVRIGLGDDAAFLRGSARELVTTDTLVDGVHFERDWLSATALGRRAFRVAVSDIAAMGGRPRYALLSLILPTDYAAADVRRLAAGFIDDAASVGTALVGGNISRGPVLALTVTVIGRAVRRVLRRSEAHDGDAIVVTGTLGDAAAGVARLRAGETRGALVEAYRTPPLRIELGARLSLGSDVTAMLDISDGLVQDLGHICKASGVDARIDVSRLPLSAALRRMAKDAAATSRTKATKRKKEPVPLDLALGGGDDYELLMTVGRGDAGVARVVSACKRAGVQATVLGGVRASRRGGRVFDIEGDELSGGWDHLVQSA
jgi:thiamine-monophosphate kinase